MAKPSRALKIAVVGPKNSGKTLLCKLLAEQVCSDVEGQSPTAGLRIQELDHYLASAGKTVSVQLWDCSGDLSYAKYFPLLARGTQGLILVYDANHDQEAELETFYRTFAQPNKLTMSQVLIVSTSCNDIFDEVHLRGKMNALTQVHVNLSHLVGKENSGKAFALLKQQLDVLFEAAASKR